MRRPALASLLGLALVLAACGGPDTGNSRGGAWPGASQRIVEEGHAPTPFTAAQIREGCPEGRVATFRVIQAGRDPFLQFMRFHDADAEGVEVEMGMMLENGNPVSTPASRRSTWEELQRHASFEADRTILSEGEVTVEAGTFPCFLYEVRVERSGEPPATTRAWFAKTLPGPPVKMEKVVAGQTQLVSELVSNVIEETADAE